MKPSNFLKINVLFAGCQESDYKAKKNIRRSHPSHEYTFVPINTITLKFFETDYLPVYSGIYHQDGTKKFPITATISIRNTSLSDSAYIQSIMIGAPGNSEYRLLPKQR